MSTTLPDLEIIEALDFEYEPACEHSEHTTRGDLHGGPAWGIVRNLCPRCGSSRVLYICHAVWEANARVGMRHSACGWRGTRDETWTLLGLVGE